VQISGYAADVSLLLLYLSTAAFAFEADETKSRRVESYKIVSNKIYPICC